MNRKDVEEGNGAPVLRDRGNMQEACWGAVQNWNSVHPHKKQGCQPFKHNAGRSFLSQFIIIIIIIIQ